MTQTLNYNRLKDENSLYLKQHQNNPIHWWPYGIEAISYAQKMNLPIFLSVGYSACHWCHVMSHESFSNEEIANYLNQNFVCIKIDREEYPDIDSYYQKVVPFFGKNGGWPLSVFLKPDMKAFFAGTYFPTHSNKQSIGFLELIQELHLAYKDNLELVEKNASEIYEQIKLGHPVKDRINFPGHFPNPASILDAIKGMKDEKNGGYTSAPKFPQFAFYEWALEQMLEGMVPKEHGEFIIKSLERMLMGGIFDHARGGIHRYSTDEFWKIPHFEKMLYDQCGFLKTYNKLSLIYPSPIVFDSLIQTLEYLEKEMLNEEKFCFSAQDADSEGVEGLYFTFLESEFDDALNRNDDENETLSKNRDKIKKWFQITENGNFENNLNVISLDPNHRDEFIQKENWDIVRKVKKALLLERALRVPPHTDNKGISGHNFMLVTALVDLVQYTTIDLIRNKATQFLNILLNQMFNEFIEQTDQGMRLKHTNTTTHSYPYLEDFVFFCETQIRLFEITANPIFRQNFKDSLDFITHEFLQDEKLLTRPKFSESFSPLLNESYSCFDQSYKSCTATYLMLMKRATVLFSDKSYLEKIEKLEDFVQQTILKINPVSGGEALRALTYPMTSYRKILVPKSFSTEQKFKNLMPYFLHRFVIDYHEDANQDWQMCQIETCELKGVGVEELVQTLTPKNQEN